MVDICAFDGIPQVGNRAHVLEIVYSLRHRRLYMVKISGESKLERRVHCAALKDRFPGLEDS